MKNKFLIEGELLKIFIKRKTGEILEALCDSSDFDIISQYTWSARKCGKKMYVVHAATDTYIHKLIAPFKMVDHKNRNPLDNRRSNLRSTNHSENGRNIDAKSNSKSGVLGIYKRKDCNRYQVFVTIDKKVNYLGLFKTLKQASLVRREFINEVTLAT